MGRKLRIRTDPTVIIAIIPLHLGHRASTCIQEQRAVTPTLPGSNGTSTQIDSYHTRQVIKAAHIPRIYRTLITFYIIIINKCLQVCKIRQILRT